MREAFYEPEADESGYIHLLRTDNNNTPAHFHNSVELAFVVRGDFRARGGGEEAELHAGDIFCAEAYVTHLYASDEDARVYVLVLSESYLRDFRAQYAGSLPQFMRAGEDANAPVFRALDGAYAQWKSWSPLMKRGFADYLLGLLALRYPPLPRRADKEGMFIAEVLRYIGEHCGEPLSVRSLADRFGYTPNYFSALFNRYTAAHFRDYLGSVRLQKAEALRADGAGIGEAALQSGFLSPNTYYRALAREKSRQGKEVRTPEATSEKS